ncbi:phosphoenolpyruvate--protein phosphotransferase [Oceanobacillus sp. CAU 1775]
MQIIQGFSAAPGIAIAKVYKLKTGNIDSLNKEKLGASGELERLDEALRLAIIDVEQIKQRTIEKIGEEEAEIFNAHFLILQDPEFLHSIRDKIVDDGYDAESALREVTEEFISLFKAMDHEYIRERAIDITDVSRRVYGHLVNEPLPDFSESQEEVIIISDDLTPSQTAEFNNHYIKGIATNFGSVMSHSTILARMLEIPAVVGVEKITEKVQTGDTVIIDGANGTVIINPSAEVLNEYKMKMNKLSQDKIEEQLFKDERTFTKDKVEIELLANISSADEVDMALKYGAEGIGLFRTEYIYMESDALPTENEQYEAIKYVLEKMGDKPVVVRTLDIGGDKKIPYIDTPIERNPFLGFRSIRFCLANEDIFRPHLRALIRASIHGDLRIMFPMVATLEEFREAKSIFLEEKQMLIDGGVAVSDNIELGIMIETPSAALLARQFAKEVDFFSIGTNDLIQYTLAADRMNLWVSNLYQPCHPAVLQLIHLVYEAAKAEGISVSMCGEMASDPVAIPILLGLGLDKLSMNPASVLATRKLIRRVDSGIFSEKVEEILSMGTAGEVEALVRELRG